MPPEALPNTLLVVLRSWRARLGAFSHESWGGRRPTMPRTLTLRIWLPDLRPNPPIFIGKVANSLANARSASVPGCLLQENFHCLPHAVVVRSRILCSRAWWHGAQTVVGPGVGTLHQELPRGCSTSANSTSDNSTSASWPKSKLARSRNWPKSKLAEVEINWPKSNRWCLLCLFFLSFFFFDSFALFLLFFTFFLFLLISLFILFLFCFCFRPQKPELIPKPRTFRRPPSGEPPSGEPPSAGQPSAGQPSSGQPSAGQPAGPPKISLLFSLSPHFSFFFLSLGVLSWNGVLEGWGTLKMCTFGGTTAKELQTCTFQGPGASKTPPKFHERIPRESTKGVIFRRERGKKREILGPNPSGLPLLAPPFGAHPSKAPHFVVPKFNIPKLAEIEIGRNRSWPKSKLAEVEIGRTRKKKLAEVEIGRSRSRSLPRALQIRHNWNGLPESAFVFDYSSSATRTLGCRWVLCVFQASGPNSCRSSGALLALFHTLVFPWCNFILATVSLSSLYKGTTRSGGHNK